MSGCPERMGTTMAVDQPDLLTVRYGELIHDVLLDDNLDIFIGRSLRDQCPDTTERDTRLGNPAPGGKRAFVSDSRTERDSIGLNRFDQYTLYREQFDGGVPFRDLRPEVTPSEERTVVLPAELE